MTKRRKMGRERRNPRTCLELGVATTSITKKAHVKACELRVQKDLSELDPGSTPGVTVTFPDPSNLLEFKVEVVPTEGLYKGAKFNFTVTVPHQYPFSAPQVVCDTLVRTGLFFT